MTAIDSIIGIALADLSFEPDRDLLGGAEGQVFGAWERVVGPDLAAHCRPVKLVDGELTVEAESTAWATQLRLLAGRLLRQIAKQVGPNVVTRLHIHGPSAPTWSRGPRRVPGRGPRDTYG